MMHVKKIMSTTGLLLISSMVLISSVTADNTATSTTSVDGTTTSATTDGTNASVTTTSADGSTTSVTTDSTDATTTSTTTDTSTTSTTSTNEDTEDESDDNSAPAVTEDRNNDGVVDAFEKCAFVEKKTEAECNAIKEAIKKQMWEMYGSGAYNPNAFQKNEKGGVIIKEMFQMKKKMQSEIKDMRKDMKEQVKEKKEEIKQMRKHLSEKLHNQLMKGIEKFTAERLNKVLANIEKAVAKVTASSMNEEKKAHMLGQLAEIKAIIQDKLDALSGSTTESTLIQDVLSGTGE
ncbi:MAG: hypothetical protein Q8K26_00615 [Candidatus Gracilibacteria bacterium]|nr:hypothetical protein [Candidatus Gracilibacteria bacterium]